MSNGLVFDKGVRVMEYRAPFTSGRQTLCNNLQGTVSLYDKRRVHLTVSVDRSAIGLSISHYRLQEPNKCISEVSCVLEEIKSVVMARPMIFSDETRPTNFTFANQVGVRDRRRVNRRVCTRRTCSYNPKPSLACQPGNVIRVHTNHVINLEVATATTS